MHDATDDPTKKGGVGKTWLLRKCARIAKERAQDIAVVVIDFFNVAERDGVEIAQRIVQSLQEVYPEWLPAAFLEALKEYNAISSTSADANEAREKLHSLLADDLRQLDRQLVGTNKRLLIFFDTYETVELYPTIATLSLVHRFPDQYHFQHLGAVIAGRNAPDWDHPNWQGREQEVQCLPIQPFTPEETLQFLNENITSAESIESTSAEARALYAGTEGRPILVALANDMLNGGVLTLKQLQEVPKDRFESFLVERINRLEKPDPINIVVLMMAHVYHRFNTTLLDSLIRSVEELQMGFKDASTSKVMQKMLKLSFVRHSDTADNVILHDEMRRLVNKYNWPAQELSSKEYRLGLSQGAIHYYKDLLNQKPSEQMQRTYQVEMLHHELFVDINEGFSSFEKHMDKAMNLWQNAFGRSLLQEMKQFVDEFSSEQRYKLSLAEAGLLYKEENSAAALKLYEQIEQEASDDWLEEHRGLIFFQKGSCYYQMNQIPEAIANFEKSKEIEAALDSKASVATILSRLGLIARRTGNLSQAENYYEQSLAILKDLGNPIRYADTLNSLGNLYRLLGKTEEALRWCIVAWRIRKILFAKREASEVAVGLSLATISTIYLRVDDLENAKKFCEDAFDIFRRNSYKKGIAITYNRFGYIAMARNELEQAMNWFKKGYSEALGIDAEAEINSLNKQGWVHVLQGELDSAILMLEKAIGRAREVKDAYQEAESLIDLADVLERRGRSEQFQKTLADAEEIAGRYNYYYLLGIAQMFQGDNKYNAKMYHQAFEYFCEYCHYMALYNPVQYDKAIRKTIELLLTMPEEDFSSILDYLERRWLTFQLGENTSAFLHALEEVRVLTGVMNI